MKSTRKTKIKGRATPNGGQEKYKVEARMLFCSMDYWKSGFAYLITIALSCESPHNLGRLLDDENCAKSLEKSQDRVRSSNDGLPDPV